MDVNKGAVEGLKWSRYQWCEGIHPHGNDPEHRMVDPDKQEHQEPIEYSPQKSHWNAEHNDEEVIHYDLDILVYKTNNVEELRNCLGAFVLIETFIEIHLHLCVGVGGWVGGGILNNIDLYNKN